MIEARLDYCSRFVHYFGVAGRWTNDDYFRFDIALGLMRARVRGVRRLFTEEERERIARTIVEHLRRSRWHWWREEGSVEPGYMARMPVRSDGESSDGEARQ